MNDQTNTPRGWRNPNFIQGDAAARAEECVGRSERLRRKLAEGLALGTFLIELPTAHTVTALALAGFDFVVLDMEHSSIDFATLQTLICASNACGLVTLVRPWSTEPGIIGKILDCGAHGIMAPHVDSAERARDIVAQARFSPRGQRGFSPLSKFDALDSPLQTLSDAAIVVLQIEGRDGLQRVAEIAAVDGIDVIFVGPYDLSLSLQVAPGSAAVFDAAQAMANSLPAGVHMGIYIDDAARSADWAARRFALQCVSFDGRMLTDAAKQVVRTARGLKDDRSK